MLNSIVPHVFDRSLQIEHTFMSKAALVSFLEDPRAVRPGTHHPHQLADIPGASRRQVAEDLVHFLARDHGDAVAPIAPFETDAQTLERGRALFHSVGCVACHGPLESVDELEVSLRKCQQTIVRLESTVLELNTRLTQKEDVESQLALWKNHHDQMEASKRELQV